jgi:hypothetical protein
VFTSVPVESAYLLLALLLVSEILQNPSARNFNKQQQFITSSNDVLFLILVWKRVNPVNLSLFLVSSTAPSLRIEPYASWTLANFSLSSSARRVMRAMRCLTMTVLICFKNLVDWRVSRETFKGRSSASEGEVRW